MAKKKATRPAPAFPHAKKAVKKKRSTLWTPSMGLTNSAINLWSQCHEQFALRYLDGWTSRKISVPLAYGTLWHLAQEGQGTRNPWSLVDAARASSAEKLNQYALAELDWLIAQIKTIFPIYAEHYKTQDGSIKWLARESQFLIPFNVMGEELPLAGKRDGEFTTQKGTLGLFETKTKSKIDKPQTAKLLRSDFQTLLYCWSMWKERKKAPGMILYNVVKRPGSRLKANESKQDFLIRLANEVRKHKSQWFYRWQVSVTEDDMRRFEREHLLPVCQAFLTWWREVRQAPFLPERTDGRHACHYVNLNALVTPYGTADLYDLMVLRLKAPYYVRSSPHPELELTT